MADRSQLSPPPAPEGARFIPTPSPRDQVGLCRTMLVQQGAEWQGTSPLPRRPAGTLLGQGCLETQPMDHGG